MRKYKVDKAFEEEMRPKFDVIYTTYFPELKKIEEIKDKRRQFRGHDVHLHFNNGEKMVIDEKVRRSDWNDILIEYLSNKQTGREGWIYKNESDYLAYLFPKKGCYLLDTPNIKDWVKDEDSSFWDFEDVESENEGIYGPYTTVCKAVPLDFIEGTVLVYQKFPPI